MDWVTRLGWVSIPVQIDGGRTSGPVPQEIWLLRPRVLMARARGDESAYRGWRDRYRDLATSLEVRGTYGVGRGDGVPTAYLLRTTSPPSRHT